MAEHTTARLAALPEGDGTPLGPLRPVEAILTPQACLENDVRKALGSFGPDDRVELIMLAADEYAAAAVHLFARGPL